MKEVEVKVKINNLDEVEKKFNEIGVNFSDVIEQEDYIYTRPEVANNMDSIIKDENILRIRKAKGKIMFTLKRPQTGGLDKIEREVEVSDDAQMKDILEYLGKNNKLRPKLVIGFSAETENLIENSTQKLKQKYCDMIIANDIGRKYNKDTSYNEIVIVDSKIIINVPRTKKERLSKIICKNIEKRF